MTLGERIKQARKNQGLTQRGLAKKLGISSAYIQQLELGQKTNPSYLIASNINSILGECIYELENDRPFRLVDLNLQGISPSDEFQKVQEENKEFEMAILECLCNPNINTRNHAIEEFWDKVQSSLSYLQVTLGINADDVMEQYHLHLEKLKNRPR
jgi:transcriptional regulator with XRE-family HTH domain